jgi:hypothetical protein
MIYLGYNNNEKEDIINNHIKNNDFDRVYFISHEKFLLNIKDVEIVTYKDIIEYAYYYRIIENTTKKTLIVLNELLRDKNRNNLTYNCIRTFLNNTQNVMVFNFLPIIENREDFCSLYDFATQSNYKYSKFDNLDISQTKIFCKQKNINFNFVNANLDMFANESYEAYKTKLFNNFNKKDPDIIPRELQIYSSKFKEYLITDNGKYMFRNKRLKKNNIYSYKQILNEGKYIIFDIPFNNIDIIDFLFFSQQLDIDVISSDLKIDIFFKNKLINFKTELDYVYAKLYKN